MDKSEDEKPLVLIVDDLADNREIYAAYLEFEGYRVAQATDGHEALAKAFELRPDAVLMDLSLPGIDGWEVTRRLKQDEATKTTLVIALSGHTRPEYVDNAKASGCDAFMAKPCLPETVADEIRRALGKSKTSFKLP
jgi:two-component system cell cycle response regulator DivK